MPRPLKPQQREKLNKLKSTKELKQTPRQSTNFFNWFKKIILTITKL